MYLQPTSRKPKALLAALVVGTLVLVASPALMGAPAQAQQGPTPTVTLATTITFAGTVDSLGPRFIVVDGLMVDLQRATLPPGGLQLGAIVTVVGTVQNSVVQATVVQLGGIGAGTSSATPAVVIPAATSTPLPGTTIAGGVIGRASRIIIQGPVRQISTTSMLISDLTVTFDRARINTSNIRVGDYVRVVGDFSTANNALTITAVTITPTNPTLRRGSDDTSLRDSGSTNRNSGTTSDRQSDRQSERQTPPPPDSNRSSASGASSRSS